VGDLVEVLAVGIEQANRMTKRNDQAARTAKPKRTDLGRESEPARIAAREIVPVDRASEDIAVPEDVAPSIVDRAFAELATNVIQGTKVDHAGLSSASVNTYRRL
jgi:hypothetical protein